MFSAHFFILFKVFVVYQYDKYDYTLVDENTNSTERTWLPYVNYKPFIFT